MTLLDTRWRSKSLLVALTFEASEPLNDVILFADYLYLLPPTTPDRNEVRVAMTPARDLGRALDQFRVP